MAIKTLKSPLFFPVISMQIAKQYFDALDKLLVHISMCLVPHFSVVNRHLYGVSIFSVANFGYLFSNKPYTKSQSLQIGTM